MGLRLVLAENDIFHVDELKIRLSECRNVGRSTVTATFNVFFPDGEKSITLSVGDSLEVVPSVFIEIWPTGSFERNLLSVLVSAPKEMFIKRENYEHSNI